MELLDVRHPDSPYGLIQEVLQGPPSNRPSPAANIDSFRTFQSNNDLGGLNPKEVYLADGDLLILKGGTTSDSTGKDFDNVWPAIDNYELLQRRQGRQEAEGIHPLGRRAHQD